MPSMPIPDATRVLLAATLPARASAMFLIAFFRSSLDTFRDFVNNHRSCVISRGGPEVPFGGSDQVFLCVEKFVLHVPYLRVVAREE